MEQELKQVIDEYIRAIEANESQLVHVKAKIDVYVARAEQELQGYISALDVKFDANEVTEEEFLAQVRSRKAEILADTKTKLNDLVATLQSGASEGSSIDEAKLAELKKRLNL